MIKLLQTAVLASFLLTITGTAVADIGILPKGNSYNSQILIVTGRPTGTVATECGITGPLFRVVVIPAGGGQPRLTDLIFVNGDLPSAGDRFELNNETSCSVTHQKVEMFPR